MLLSCSWGKSHRRYWGQRCGGLWGLHSIVLVEEGFEPLSKPLRLLQHWEMPRQRKPLDLRVTDSLLHRLPLFRVDNDVAVTVYAHCRHFDLIQHRTQVCTAERADGTQKGFQ